MEILFPTALAQRLCSSRSRLEERWGVQRATGIMQRFSELSSLQEIDDIAQLLGPMLRWNGTLDMVVTCPAGGEIIVRPVPGGIERREAALLVVALGEQWFVEEGNREVTDA